MTTIVARFGRYTVSAAVAEIPPLGWRFWTLAGFPGDPIDPRPYGGTRCLPLTIVDLNGDARWLCAMEQDRSFRLFASHDLFPCADQEGADAFAHELLANHARQPKLL
jgi:hypothetical protein